MYKNQITVQLIILTTLLAMSMFVIHACKTDDPELSSPFISDFSQTTGIEGETIVITGKNFSATASENVVMFNGTAATVSAATTSQLEVIIPAGATKGKITVTVNGKTATSAKDFAIATPAIIGFTPITGAIGSSVTINGTFSSTASENVVTFNGVAAIVASATSTQLVVSVPVGATTGKIAVTVRGKIINSLEDFVVIAPPTITTITPLSGTIGSTVVITGNYFSLNRSENLVKFNGVIATVTQATSTQLTVTVPTGATTGKIAITVKEKEVVSVDNFIVINIPTITSFTPLTGTLGATVTITGTNFSTVLSENIVKFNGIEATVIGAAVDKLEVTVPSTSTGKITIQVGTLITTSADDFVYYLPVMVSTFAGNSTTTPLNSPCAVAVDGSGNVYVADWAYQRIHKITANGVVSTFAGNGQLNYPYGVAVDGSGNVYVADRYNHRIAKITPAGVVSTLAGSGVSGFADGPALTAQFNEPVGVAVDGAGNIYVADVGNQRIRKITSAGVVSTLAGNGVSGFADGNGAAAMFSGPWALAVDANGNVYVADQTNHRIRKITASGVVSTLAGNGTPSYVDGTGTAAQFSSPAGIAIDGSGNIIVADYGDGHIRKITPGGVVTTLAGSTSGFADGTGTTAKFSGILGITLDASNNIFAADQNNHRVRKISAQ